MPLQNFIARSLPTISAVWLNLVDQLLIGTGGQAPNARTAAEIIAGVVPTNLAYPPGNAFRYGVDPTGVADSTVAIQNWINATWGMYQFLDAQGLWNGGGGASPVMQLPPGKFKVSGTMFLPTGVTFRGTGHPANTTNHTRIIMNSTATSPPNGAGDNRNKPMFKFRRGTLPSGGVLDNSACTSTIQELEFWFVTGSNDFSNPLSGAGITFAAYPLGGTFAFDVDSTDFRFISCVFQNTPCCFWGKDVTLTPSIRGDGFIGNRGIGVFFEECEFDTAAAHVWMQNCNLDLFYKNCQFFGGRHRYDGCTGKVVYQTCRWHGNAYVDAATVPNTLSEFALKGCDIEINNANAFLLLSKSLTADISDNCALIGASGASFMELTDADGGLISSNAINNSGFNAPAGTGIADFVAAIKMRGCRQMLVEANSIFLTAAATYGGFGILSGSSARAPESNFFTGNSITAPYNGANFNNQDRYLNVGTLDILGVNFDLKDGAAVAAAGNTWFKTRMSIQKVQPVFGANITIDASLANAFEVVATTGAAFTILNPTNIQANTAQEITITIFNFSGGALGAITFGANYKLSALVAPANTFNKSICFRFDGTNLWREFARTPADVPN